MPTAETVAPALWPAARADWLEPVARLRPVAEIATLEPEWEALAREVSEPNPFAEHWFVAASLATLGAAGDLRIAEVRRADRLIGVMVLAIGAQYARLPLAFVENWTHHHLFLGTPLVRAGDESAFWRALLLKLDESAWASNFLHLRGLAEGGPVHRGLEAAARETGRTCATVHRETRAMLESDLDSATYYAQAVRAKKRKEYKRLRARLAEIGPIVLRRLEHEDALAGWCDTFLALERGGWKGEAGSALACAPETEAFFRRAIASARSAGRLEFLRLDVGERPIAMLVNFLSPPGSFSFKTCFDESFARFSPGVLIQIENLAILDRADIGWMDSCAAENHPMIDNVWRERRNIVQVTLRLKGPRRSLVFFACRALESGSALKRRWLGRARK